MCIRDRSHGVHCHARAHESPDCIQEQVSEGAGLKFQGEASFEDKRHKYLFDKLTARETFDVRVITSGKHAWSTIFPDAGV